MRTDFEFARYLDSTLLKQDATEEQMRAHLELAKKYHFKTVAIGCAWIPFAKENLAGSDVGIDAPIGYQMAITLRRQRFLKPSTLLQRVLRKQIF